MLVNRLRLLVVLRMRPLVRARQVLLRLVVLESRVEAVLCVRQSLIRRPLATVTERQVIVRRQVLRVDRQRMLKLGDRLVELL